MRCYDRAIELNPLESFPYRANGIFHMILGEIPEAESYITKAFELDSSLALKQVYASLLTSKEEYKTARDYIDKLKTEYKDVNFDFKEAAIYALNGQRKKALEKIESFSWIGRMNIFSILDMKNESLNEIQQMTEYHQKNERSRYLRLKYDSWLENLRSHPHFPEVLAIHKEIYEENLRKYGDIDI
jgi:tetratricopeptide (TPR) repeat protein